MSLQIIIENPEPIVCTFQRLSDGELFTIQESTDYVYQKLRSDINISTTAINLSKGLQESFGPTLKIIRLEGTLTVKQMVKLPDKKVGEV